MSLTSLDSAYSYGLPAFPVQPSSSAGTNRLQSVLTANNFVSYLTVLAVMDALGSTATQRILYKKAVKDYQTANGVDFSGRFINSIAITTPLIVYWQNIASPSAQEKRQRVCVLPQDQGSGVEALSRYRYYYDQSSDTCRQFTYRGTTGNENRFSTLNSCELTCRPFSSEGKNALKDAILLSQRADGFVFLADTIFGSLGTTIYVILYKLFGFGSQALARM